jgi:hypothetical protein
MTIIIILEDKMPKQVFKAAFVAILNYKFAVVWLDKRHIGQEEELKKYLKFYQDLFGDTPTALMMIDDKEEPVYYGKLEVVELLKKHFWKQFHWQEFELEKTVT